MTTRVVIASGNPGKLTEFCELLSESELEPVAPASVGVTIDVEETGRTYMENARAKARGYVSATGLPALADDSGIEVDALGGAPGIYSARYGGPGLTDQERLAKLLEQIAGVAENGRTARYRCALVLCTPQGKEWSSEGLCEGLIATQPRGTRGFGYDPIFLLPQLGRTMAELTSQQKNQLSHRARAVQALLQILSGQAASLSSHHPESIAFAHAEPVASAHPEPVEGRADNGHEFTGGLSHG